MTPSYAQLIAASLILGFLLGLVWEVFRILRRAVSHGSLWVAVEDLLFFLLASVLYWIVCFSFSFGIPRWFSLFSLVLGFWLYLKTLGIVLSALSQQIIRAIVFCMRWVKGHILLVFLRVCKRLFLWLTLPFRRLLSHWRVQWQKRKRKRQIRGFLEMASRGFSDL